MSNAAATDEHHAHLSAIRDPGTSPDAFVGSMEALGRQAAIRLVADLEPCVHAVHLVGSVEDHDGFTEGLRAGLHGAGFTVSVGTYWLRTRKVPGEPWKAANADMAMRHLTAEPESPFALVLSASVAGTQEKVVGMAADASALGPKSLHVVSAISHSGFPDLVKDALVATDAARIEFASLETDPTLGTDEQPAPGIGGGTVASRSGLPDNGPAFVPDAVRKAVETSPDASPAARLVAHDGRTFPSDGA